MAKRANPFLTKAQRNYLIDEYIEQLEEFDQLEEYPDMKKDLERLSNPALIQECEDFMPLIMQMLAQSGIE